MLKVVNVTYKSLMFSQSIQSETHLTNVLRNSPFLPNTQCVCLYNFGLFPVCQKKIPSEILNQLTKESAE